MTRSVDSDTGTTRPGRWALLVVPAALILAVLFAVIIVLAGHALFAWQLPSVMQRLLHTGEIGDTFGGLLGPVLTAGALAATVWFSYTQIQQARKQFTEERQSELEDQQLARAEGVVAWVAETAHSEDEQSHLGLVISNTTHTLVRNMDVLLDVAHVRGDEKVELRNREALVPPGTWFLQIDRDTVEDDAGGDVSGSRWPTPLPVRSDGLFEVSLPSPTPGASFRTYALRVHSPETSEEEGNHAYYSIVQVRYDLQGRQWWRQAQGAPDKEVPDGVDEARWEVLFAPLATVPRPALKRPSPRKSQAVQERVLQFASALTGVPDEALQADEKHRIAPEFQDAGITAVRITGRGAGQALDVYADEDEPVLWIQGKEVEGTVNFPSVLKSRANHGGKHCKLPSLRRELVNIEDPAELAKAFIARLRENLENGTICGCNAADLAAAVAARDAGRASAP